MKIAIVDDELFFLTYLQRILSEIDEKTQTYVFSSGSEFRRTLGYQIFDAIFIDVDLRNENGIELARDIKKQTQTPIIFITGYLNRLYDLHDLDIMAILSKPFNEQDVRHVYTRIPVLYHYPVIWVETEREKIALHLSEIIYVETYYGGCTIVTETERIETSRYLFKKYLNDLLDYGFIRIQQSFYVNPEHIRSFKASSITLSNKYKLAIGRSYIKEVRTAYAGYLKEETL